MENYRTVQETANIIRVKEETVRRYIRKGLLPAANLSGGSYIINDEDIKFFIDQRTNNRILTMDIAKDFLDNNINVQTDNISNLPIGTIISWNEISSIYSVDSGKGIKINKINNYAVIITDVQFRNSNNIYPDIYCSSNNSLYYVGEGKEGNMDPNNPRNSFLKNSLKNNSTIIVYQYLEKGHYSNCGVFKLEHVSRAMQPDSIGSLREVLIYKFKPIIQSA